MILFAECMKLCCVDIAFISLEAEALQETLDSLSMLGTGQEAWVMYELNPLYWQVDVMRMRTE